MIDGRTCFPAGTPVAALPPWGRTRLFLPLTGARWRASALYPASRPVARAARLAVRLAVSLGLTPSHAAAGIAVPLAGAIGSRRVVALIPGTPGPATKATLALADDTGRIDAFLKVGQTAAAVRRLRQERTVLADLPARLGPSLLDFQERDGMALLLVGAVAGRALPWLPDPPPSLRTAIAALHVGAPRPAAEHPWLTHLLADVGEPGRGEPGRAWGTALARRAWPVSIRHGDLLYSHVVVDGDRVRLIDWEYGVADGFPWVDYAHLLLHTAVLIARRPPARARRDACAHLRHWPGLDGDEAAAIVGIAAFAAYRDGAADGHPDASPLQAWRRAVWSGTP